MLYVLCISVIGLFNSNWKPNFFLWTPTFEKTNFERVGLSGTKISPFLTGKGGPNDFDSFFKDFSYFSRISPIFIIHRNFCGERTNLRWSAAKATNL